LFRDSQEAAEVALFGTANVKYFSICTNNRPFPALKDFQKSYFCKTFAGLENA
jgi:hypothetical protein